MYSVPATRQLLLAALKSVLVLFSSFWLVDISSASTVATSVGRVAMAVGDGQRITAGGVEPLRVGTLLYEGDRIHTGSDAFVILVFSDEGRLSVRPSTELHIRRYRVDPLGANHDIALELSKGAVRQISGNASRARPESYRLHTPVAAIGVRGTDFLAKTTDLGLETLVQEGRIVIRGDPLACASDQCRMLSADGQAAGTYVRLSSKGDIEKRSYVATDVEQSFSINMVLNPLKREALNQWAEGQRARLEDGEMPRGAQFVSATIFTVPHGGLDRIQAPPPAAGSGGQGTTSDQASGGVGQGSQASGGGLGGGGQSSDNGAGSVTNDNPLSAAEPLLARQLVWGRFSNASSFPAQWLVSYGEAAQGRHVTVGELGQYALWRSGPNGPMNPGLAGTVNFKLVGAEAVLDHIGIVSQAAVLAASLQINFDRSSFVAGVDVSHQATGLQQIRVNGLVNNEGVFVGIKDDERVAGSLSRDGSEAGYLFSKDTKSGQIRGVSLWRR